MKLFLTLLTLFSLEINERVNNETFIERQLRVSYSEARKKSENRRHQSRREENFQLKRNDSFDTQQRQNFHNDD